MRMKSRCASRAVMMAALCISCPVISGSAAAADDAKITAIKAKRILPATGPAIENGVVLIAGGKITAIGVGLDIPSDATLFDFGDAVVTPGLIDANCTIGFDMAVSQRTGFYSETAKNSVDPAPLNAPTKSKSLWAEILAHAETSKDLTHVACDGDDNHACDVCGATCGGGAWLAAQQQLAAAESIPFYASWAEHASEVTPHYRVVDSVNFYSSDFKRLIRGGVTTVFIAPDSGSVIGTRGAIVKTGGPMKSRIVREADAVKASMGEDPSQRGGGNQLPPAYGPAPTFMTRRPTTRMGVEFVFRKAFYDADRAGRGLPISGADHPPLAAVSTLQLIRKGEVPLRIQARKQHDIFEAIRLSREFNIPFILEEATEGYLCLPELKASKTPVIYGPIFMDATGWRRSTGEADEPRLNAPKQLFDAGIPFALAAQERRDEEGLVRQGMFATMYGLSADEALKAITSTPASLLKLDGFGSLATGSSADIVVWTGDPFSPTSRAKWVMIGGQVVLDE